MYCQSCGTQNPEDAKFCKACGTPIAGPGDKGGLIPDDTVQVMETLPGTLVEPAPSPSDTVRDPSDEAEERPKPPSQKAAAAIDLSTLPPELSVAGAQMRDNTISKMSISLAEMGIRSPRRTGLIALGIGLALLTLGALGMYLFTWLTQPEQAVVASVPDPQRFQAKMSIGFPESGSPDEETDDGVGSKSPAARRPTGGGSAKNGVPASNNPASGSSSAPTKTPAASGGAAPSGGKAPASGGSGANTDDDPRSSSTKVEAPANPGSGASTKNPGSSGGGTSSERSPFDDPASLPGGTVEDSRDLVMDSYAGDVRRVIRQYYSARAGNCYERATRNNAFLRGTVVIAFTIGLEGNVTNARSVHNTTGDEPLAACLAGQVGSWRLPPPPRDRPVNFEMPFSW